MFYSERATFEFVDPVRYSASDRLGSSDLMMSCGLRRCPPSGDGVTHVRHVQATATKSSGEAIRPFHWLSARAGLPGEPTESPIGSVAAPTLSADLATAKNLVNNGGANGGDSGGPIQGSI